MYFCVKVLIDRPSDGRTSMGYGVFDNDNEFSQTASEGSPKTIFLDRKSAEDAVDKLHTWVREKQTGTFDMKIYARVVPFHPQKTL